jgi:hypothetical protein
MVEMVKKVVVNCANFGHETNTNHKGKWESKLDTLITKKASPKMDVVEVNKELKVIDNVKAEKGIKEKNEPLPRSIGKVGEISPWIQKKKE